MSGLISRQRAGQIRLDFLLSLAAILVAELHANAGRPLAPERTTFGVTQITRPATGSFSSSPMQVEEHEYLITQAVITVGRDEQAAVTHKRHIGKIQGALVFDRQGQETRLIPTGTQFSLPRHTQVISSSTGAQAPQKTLQRQSPIDRRIQRGLEIADPVQQLEKLPYIQDRLRAVASRLRRAHFCQKPGRAEMPPDVFREPVLKAAEPQRQLGLHPALGRRDGIAGPACRLVQAPQRIRPDPRRPPRCVRFGREYRRRAAENIQHRLSNRTSTAGGLEPGNGIRAAGRCDPDALAATQNSGR